MYCNSCMTSLAYVLCFSVLIKASDRNLVGNKGEYSVKCEIEDLKSRRRLS